MNLAVGPRIMERPLRFFEPNGLYFIANRTVQGLLGHSTIGMPMRYAHLSPDVRRGAVKALTEKPPRQHDGNSASGEE